MRSSTRPALTRRRFTGPAGATLAAGLVPPWSSAAASERGLQAGRRRWQRPRPPRLPSGFARTFRSRFMRAGGLRQHAVIGGDGPPLLLVHRRPQNWSAWRMVIPTPARDFQVIAADYYVRLVSGPETLRGSFAFYRAWDATVAQNGERAKRPLTMPVLAIGGAASWGAAVGGAMSTLATDVRSVVVPDCGHWVAEEAPRQMLAALNPFLARHVAR